MRAIEIALAAQANLSGQLIEASTLYLYAGGS
jgi:hypothetical protein